MTNCVVTALTITPSEPQPAVFLGIVEGENDGEISAVVRYTSNGLYLHLVHPSRVRLEEDR